MDPVTFFAILIWMAVAKGAVYLLEDSVAAVRGQQSPRQKARAAHQKAEASGQTSKPSGFWGRARAATGDYLAGVVEDATASTRARKRRAQARKAGTRAIDGVFIDLTDDNGFFADCDVCDWSSRRYRLETNALGAGRDHTRTEHPDLYQADPEPQPNPANTQTATSTAAENSNPAQPGAGTAPQGARPALRVIVGGRDENPPTEQPAPVVHADDHTYCSTPNCPTCRPLAGTHGWACGTCGTRREGFATETDARTDATGHPCTPTTTPDSGSPDDLMDLVEATQIPVVGNPADNGKHEQGSNTVNLDANGPEEIRAAFTTAADIAGERAEEITGLAGVLAEAADNFENKQMAPTTVEHMREAAEAFQAAKGLLDNAQESLQAALADFNSRDGHVADTVADAGGNLASRDVLVG